MLKGKKKRKEGSQGRKKRGQKATKHKKESRRRPFHFHSTPLLPSHISKQQRRGEGGGILRGDCWRDRGPSLFVVEGKGRKEIKT